MKNKQAVVLIHGIGEQRPMDNLRAFVNAVLPPAASGQEQYWSKPDPMAELFELRRLQKVGRPGTHFFEYYWAYHVEGTRFSHLLSWVVDLIRRRKTDVPAALHGVWRLSRLLIGALLITTFFGGAGHVFDWYQGLPHSGLIWLGISAVLAVLQYFLIYFLGDAARYLSPQPDNIQLRQKIRAEGLQLLRKLHESGEYDRIIVVGHSLGSVIGYDLITRLWQEYNHVFAAFTPGNPELPALLEKGGSPQPQVRDQLPAAGDALKSSTPNALDKWQDAQRAAWKEQRHWGNPWLISDFVTLGSPLAHAMLLLANDAEDFAQRIRQRELPTCPPQHDTKGYAYVSDASLNVDGKKFCPLVLHHAAPFAVTRWTNLYFPVKAGIGGDFIGGPLRDVLGPGIRDVPVHCPRYSALRNHTPLAHTTYWQGNTAPAPAQAPPQTATSKEVIATLTALRRALNLRQLNKYKSGQNPSAGDSNATSDD